MIATANTAADGKLAMPPSREHAIRFLPPIAGLDDDKPYFPHITESISPNFDCCKLFGERRLLLCSWR